MVDLLLGGWLLFAAWYGWHQGLVRQVISLLGVVLAFVIARLFHTSLVPWVAKFVAVDSWSQETNVMVQTVVSFLVLFLILIAAVKMAGIVLQRAAKAKGLKQVNRVGGLLIGLVIAVFLAALTVNLLRYVPNGDLQLALNESQIRVYLLDVLQDILPL